MNLQHPDFTSAATTGDIPVAVYGIMGGDPEFCGEISYADCKALWSGCLDAPDYIPQGDVVAVIIQGCYEGTTPRTFVRGEC